MVMPLNFKKVFYPELMTMRMRLVVEAEAAVRATQAKMMSVDLSLKK